MWDNKHIGFRNRYMNAFMLSLAVSAVVFVPFILWGKGIFVYYIDFNVQQIPFYKLAHEAVRSGNIFWNWQTDLGANFIGSYAFYLLGSPFFWLTLPFPNWMVPYLMGPLLMLKTACAGTAAYAYLRRFTRTEKWALLGSLLYAFCGFNAVNIVFNHFHEAVIIFPLMLVAMEEYVINGRRGWFATTVFVAAVINYFFFAGQVMFLILYFVVRCLSKDFTIDHKKFFGLAFEAIAGTLMACFILVPAALAVMDNPRVEYHLWGYHILMYEEIQRYALILQSMFFPPDNTMMPNFFPDSNAICASVSLYLPLFTMTGVITFWRHYRKTWLHRLLMICFIMALVPVLNSAFFAFNGSYYARWYYMPTLMLCLATVLALEDTHLTLRTGIRISALFVLFFLLIGIIPTYEEGELVWFTLPDDVPRFWCHVAVAVVGLVLTWVVDSLRSNRQRFYRTALVLTCMMCAASTIMQVGIGHAAVLRNEYEVTVDRGIYGKKNLNLDRSQFFRMDSINNRDNLNMYWDLSSMQCFHSIVPGSIIEFYDAIGYDRGVGSRAGAEYYGLRGLFSVKYLFTSEDKDNPTDMPGFVQQDDQNGYHLFENEVFIPMGFTYDSYITRSQLDDSISTGRDCVMVQTLVLPDEVAAQYDGMLQHLDKVPSVDEEQYLAACEQRAATAGDDFSYDKTGFTSQITLDRENLVFFSVPWDQGWSATVNGEPAEIVKANVGFMAVVAPAGENTIRFTYHTPGLWKGLLIAAVGFTMLLLYMGIILHMRRRYPVNYRIRRKAHRQNLDYFRRDLVEQNLDDM